MYCILLRVFLSILSFIIPTFSIEQDTINPISDWAIDKIMSLQGAHGKTTKATFKFVDTVEFLTFLQYVGNGTEIVVPAATFPGPQDTFPLEHVIDSELTREVRCSLVHAPAPFTQIYHDSCRNRFSFVFGDKKRGMVAVEF